MLLSTLFPPLQDSVSPPPELQGPPVPQPPLSCLPAWLSRPSTDSRGISHSLGGHSLSLFQRLLNQPLTLSFLAGLPHSTLFLPPYLFSTWYSRPPVGGGPCGLTTSTLLQGGPHPAPQAEGVRKMESLSELCSKCGAGADGPPPPPVYVPYCGVTHLYCYCLVTTVCHVHARGHSIWSCSPWCPWGSPSAWHRAEAHQPCVECVTINMAVGETDILRYKESVLN